MAVVILRQFQQVQLSSVVSIYAQQLNKRFAMARSSADSAPVPESFKF